MRKLAEPQQIKRLHTILHQVPGMDAKERDEYKREQVRIFTANRTESTKDMYTAEIEELIASLQRAVPQKSTTADRMRKKMLYYAHQMKWELPTGKVDMARLDAWCIKSGLLHKPLNDYTEQELPALLTQYEKVYATYQEGLRR